MKKSIPFILLFTGGLMFNLSAQESQPVLNFRLSFLLVPFTPLMTLEASTIDKFTFQLETNFVDTHGFNIKYFTQAKMKEHYTFVGMAFVKNDLLRDDDNYTYLPYAGYGYAQRFGAKSQWTFDNRIGIGSTLNADRNGIYPIIKTGLGYLILNP